MHSGTDHHAATTRSHQLTAASCKLTDAHLFPFPSRSSPNGHEAPKANGGPHASCIPHEHVDRPCLAGPTATWEPSDRAGEPCPRTIGRPPTAEAKLRPLSAKGNKTNRTAAGQRAQHGKRSPCRARAPLATRPEIWSARSSRPHARTAPGSPLWSQCTGRNVVPVLGWGFFFPRTRSLWHSVGLGWIGPRLDSRWSRCGCLHHLLPMSSSAQDLLRVSETPLGWRASIPFWPTSTKSLTYIQATRAGFYGYAHVKFRTKGHST